VADVVQIDPGSEPEQFERLLEAAGAGEQRGVNTAGQSVLPWAVRGS